MMMFVVVLNHHQLFHLHLTAAAASSRARMRCLCVPRWDLWQMSTSDRAPAAAATTTSISHNNNNSNNNNNDDDDDNIPLPTKRRIYCVFRSPHVNQDAREHFEIRTHRRIIDIHNSSLQTIEKLTKLDLPAGVDIEVKL